jgi:manganese-transporting P-type ATPase
MEIPIENCKAAYAYRVSNTKKYVLLSVLLALYAIVIPYCYSTAGEPRYHAMLNAQKIADEKWLKESSSQHHIASEISSNDTFLANSTAPVSNKPSISDQKDFSSEATDEENENSEGNVLEKSSASSSYFSNWFVESKESKRAKKELKELKKSFATLTNEEGDPISLPPSYLPSAWACLALFSLLTLHALFHLLCHWIVFFKAYTLYSPAKVVNESVILLILPTKNRGKATFCPVKRSPITHTIQVEFQRQAYIYTPSAKLGANMKKYPNGVLTLTASPIKLAINQYLNATGLKSEAEVQSMLEKFGKNHLAVPIPSFLDLLAQQMVSPLTMFQIFCAILWLLDEYWTYTLWTLVSVVIFEATTVFQRSRTQTMLTSMAPKATPIYVYRQEKWQLLTTKDLLPSDIISLTVHRQGEKKASMDANIIPCDCVILRGSAVVNEASLTGESVPQMKEALSTEAVAGSEVKGQEQEGEQLDMNSHHRVNTLFSGTTLVNVENKSSADDDAADSTSSPSNKISLPPDQGLIAYVLRTGFNSSQGTLLQMIEFSQQSVSGDVVEIGLALLLLFIFALMAAGYVLKEGLRKKEKTTHELLLKCVMIITSVVPRQLPMQMSMAVNMALMTLTKQGIFCTEPHRVPIGGKISHCLFDKTGTLTTDQLVPVGIIDMVDINSSSAATPVKDETKKSALELRPVSEASHETAMILASCHSLVMVQENSAAPGTTPENSPPATDVKYSIVGDPIEVAALHGVEWSWDGNSSTASPGNYQQQVQKQQILQAKLQELQEFYRSRANLSPAEISNHEKQVQVVKSSLASLEEMIGKAKSKASQASYQKIQVKQRYHFSSKLQRMSVIAACYSSKKSKPDLYAFVKGSPEAIGSLVSSEHLPSWYSHQYEAMASKGLRVLALAYKQLGNHQDGSEIPRQSVESNLHFAGFIAFECKIRADSKVVVSSLRESSHQVIMVTGDSLLTSLHVAKQVDICDVDVKSAILITTSSKEFAWKVVETGEILPFEMTRVRDLEQEYNLLTTESDLLALADATGKSMSLIWTMIDAFRVFSRMSPHGKATIIRALQQGNIHDEEIIVSASTADGKGLQKVASHIHKKDVYILMCGDGGNDVGALKQADIGLALLAGHANANTTETIDPASIITTSPDTADSDSQQLSSEDALNLHQRQLEARAAEVNAKRMQHMKIFQAEFQKKQQERLKAEIEALQAKGEFMGMFGIIQRQAAETKKAMDQENARFMASHGQVWDPKSDPDAAASGNGMLDSLLGGMDSSTADSANGLPMLRPGDASVAAPFTSRIPSIRAVVDLIRQGRCTLLSALMQEQIMMLESTIAAYTLSSLSLHNARSSERQMMASSWLIMTAAVSFSYASPLSHMHPLRPLNSLFHPAIILSIFGQALIHIACMTLAVQWATDAMGPDKLHEVSEFFRKVKAHEIDRSAHCGEDDLMCQMQAFWMAPFMPNLLNSVVFLVETSQMISVFFTNYKGKFMMGE